MVGNLFYLQLKKCEKTKYVFFVSFSREVKKFEIMQVAYHSFDAHVRGPDEVEERPLVVLPLPLQAEHIIELDQVLRFLRYSSEQRSITYDRTCKIFLAIL